MVTLVTGGVFDVLHGNHRCFINNLIQLLNPTDIIILLSNDRKAAKKGYGRPMFSYEWRKEDLENFIKKTYNLPVEIVEVNEYSSSKEIYREYLGNKSYMVAMKSSFDYLKEDESINTDNLITLPEQKGQHTSTIPFLIEHGEKLSECSTHKEGAILCREGNITAMGMSGVKPHSVTKICHLHSCHKCAPGKCTYLNAAEMALREAVPGDDLFLSYPPNISAAQMIVSRMIRRLVYFQDSEDTVGLQYLKMNGVNFKKAGLL